MIEPPPKLTSGLPLMLLTWLNQLLAYVIANSPLRTTTCDLDQTVKGTRILPRGSSTAGTSTSVTPPPPWAIRKVSDTEIRVYRGVVATPDGTFTPSGFALGDSPSYVLTVSGSGVIYTFVTIDDDDGTFLSAENPDSAAALPAETPTEKYRELGSFSTDDDILTVQSNDLGTLYAVMCGGSEIEWNPPA